MKKLLIASFDLEIGGVERSLLSMLNHLDYESYQTDVMLYSHTGDFMPLLPTEACLLAESKAYKTFRMSITEIVKSGNIAIGFARLLAKYKATGKATEESGYKQMQYMWKYALPFLPKLKESYDVAISYLWPHYFVTEKVEATTKIAWIHTDFSTVETDEILDVAMWNKFDYLIAVSAACKKAFIKKYPNLSSKVVVIENITAPEMVMSLANERVENPMDRDQRFKLVTVARLSHAKGIDQAIRAMKLLKDKGYEDIAWYVVGYGGDEPMLRQLIATYNLEDNVILLGKKDNPYPYMRKANLYVQPSRYEGKAVTVTEAQILGKAVLITNYPTATSQIHNGVDGHICDKSVEGIAEAIEHLYHHPELLQLYENNCSKMDYNNSNQLEKLYELA